jgi:hypothetical protein
MTPLTKSVMRSESGSLEVRSAETTMPSPSAATMIGSSGTRVHSFGFTNRGAPRSNASAVTSGGGGVGGGEGGANASLTKPSIVLMIRSLALLKTRAVSSCVSVTLDNETVASMNILGSNLSVSSTGPMRYVTLRNTVAFCG